uniref:Uncharacterized protein n=1 Tax=Anguilla anguilla TaxID=7936 RepID=A0A0E9W223_ANGAN
MNRGKLSSSPDIYAGSLILFSPQEHVGYI